MELQNLGVHPFPDPVCPFEAPWQPFCIFDVLIDLDLDLLYFSTKYMDWFKRHYSLIKELLQKILITNKKNLSSFSFFQQNESSFHSQFLLFTNKSLQE